jgi:hypothetical protein
MDKNRRTIASGLLVIAACLCLFWGSTFANTEDESAGNAPETITQEGQPPSVPEMNEQAQTGAQTVTITGTINEQYQLVSSQGTVYEIAETEAGDVMVQYVGEEVVAKGTVTTVEDQKILSVVSFEFVEK